MEVRLLQSTGYSSLNSISPPLVSGVPATHLCQFNLD
uniref:Uncharacterized protein n=1 Tax=Anguilla anguilla TaxID=7936 RepID=A0A0E9Q2F9_ANGAN